MQKKSTIFRGIPFYEISGDYTVKGCEAFFYKMGRSKYGLKLYKEFQTAYDSYCRQRKAAKEGLAPPVKRFIAARKKGCKSIWFGYETRKVIDVDDWNDEQCKMYAEQSDNLLARLREIGLGGDFGDVNCGILDDKLVAIDFGSHSECKW